MRKAARRNCCPLALGAAAPAVPEFATACARLDGRRGTSHSAAPSKRPAVFAGADTLAHRRPPARWESPTPLRPRPLPAAPGRCGEANQCLERLQPRQLPRLRKPLALRLWTDGLPAAKKWLPSNTAHSRPRCLNVSNAAVLNSCHITRFWPRACRGVNWQQAWTAAPGPASLPSLKPALPFQQRAAATPSNLLCLCYTGLRRRQQLQAGAPPSLQPCAIELCRCSSPGHGLRLCIPPFHRRGTAAAAQATAHRTTPVPSPGSHHNSLGCCLPRPAQAVPKRRSSLMARMEGPPLTDWANLTELAIDREKSLDGCFAARDTAAAVHSSAVRLEMLCLAGCNATQANLQQLRCAFPRVPAYQGDRSELRRAAPLLETAT